MNRQPRLKDLQNALFSQLDRLDNPDLDADGLDREIRRTDALCDVSKQLVEIGGLSVKAWTLMLQNGYRPRGGPLQIAGADEDRSDAPKS